MGAFFGVLPVPPKPEGTMGSPLPLIVEVQEEKDPGLPLTEVNVEQVLPGAVA